MGTVIVAELSEGVVELIFEGTFTALRCHVEIEEMVRKDRSECIAVGNAIVAEVRKGVVKSFYEGTFAATLCHVEVEEMMLLGIIECLLLTL